ncbi:ankyrin repeat-containing domain protein [Mycena olivaceomarginata]|nr:ankyrin repeat-containing domain protein [Mycena olivaceomarginata]
MDAEERARIIDWLSPINFFLRHADISRVRQKDTGGWLLADPRFKRWESDSGRTLWCRGIPGAGKTVLASKVVDHLAAGSESKNAGVACLYLNHKEADTQTPARLLSGLWRQLVLGRDVGPLATQLYQQHHEKGTMPSLDDIYNVFNSSLIYYIKVYIVVDAIDEYPEVQRLTLLRCLAAMGPGTNLMIMSRPNIPPKASLPNLETLHIRARDEDLRKYVDAQIDSSPRLWRHVQSQPELREDIHANISGSTVDGIPERGRPKYGSLSNNLGGNAKRPLTVSELQTVLAIEPYTRRLDEENVLDIEIILAVCAGLVILDERRFVVRLVHYTTQEYLDKIQAERFPDTQTEITRTLLTLLAFDGFPHPSWMPWSLPPLIEYSQYCLVHAAGKPEGNLLETAKFLLEETPIEKHPGDSGIGVASSYGHLQMVQLLVENGANHGPPLAAASEAGHETIVQFLLKNGADANAQDRKSKFVLHMALARRQDKIARLLIENGADVNVQGEHGGALTTAVWHGMESIIPMLLDRGADVNARDMRKITRLLIENGADVNVQGEHGGALTTALWHGMESIIPMLLDRGADVNARGGQSQFALHMALAQRHEKIARFLIENGADVNVQGEHGPALTTALCHGMESIVPMLLNRGADVNARGGRYQFTLHMALAHGNEKITRLLIENGADVDLQGEHGPALTTAAWYGLESIVVLLLERGAAVNVNAHGGRCDFALHAALANGHGKIAQLLIEHGADVNLQGWKYGTALTTALWMRMEDIIPALLTRGADVNACGLYGGPLQVAFDTQNVNIARLLIENGADVDLQGEHGPALTIAAWYGFESIVILLLKRGVAVNASGGRCKFALHAALTNRRGEIARLLIEKRRRSRRGHEDLVQLLINSGADPNAHGGMALLQASRDGHENAVRLLLKHGADVNTRDINYWSAIAAAASGGHEQIVRLLIENGANVNAPGGQYGTALAEAADAGHENIVEVLIHNGADINTNDGEHWTALVAASQAGHENIVRFLLENAADVNLQDRKYGCALLAAFARGHRAIVQLLVKHGAKVVWPEMTGDSSESEQSERESDEEESTGAGYFTD